MEHRVERDYKEMYTLSNSKRYGNVKFKPISKSVHQNHTRKYRISIIIRFKNVIEEKFCRIYTMIACK